jgi:uridine kinase
MILHKTEIREILDTKIYLNLDIKCSIHRRDKTTCDDDKIYNNEVLIPMYKKYVLPTKKYADLLVDVENKNQLEVYQIVNNFLKNIGIL